MCNPGMRDRHWKGMSDIAGFDLTPDAGTTLRKMLKLNLEQYMEQFESISAGASKVSSRSHTWRQRTLKVNNFASETGISNCGAIYTLRHCIACKSVLGVFTREGDVEDDGGVGGDCL